MHLRRGMTRLLVLISLASLNSISAQTSGEVSEVEAQAYAQDLATIASVRKGLQPGKTNDLKSYEDFVDATLGKWRSMNRAYYARLTLAIIGPLSAGQFSNDRQYVLAREYALSALGGPSQIPLETELELVGHVVTNMVRGPEGEERVRQRKKDVEVTLHAWKRLTEAIDPNWDPNDLPLVNVPLPSGVGGQAGMAPQAIRDPKKRAEYEQAIKRNDEKSRKYDEQYTVRKWSKRFPPRAEEYIVQAFSKPPYNLEELGILLKEYVRDAQARTRILDAVKKNTQIPPSSHSGGSQMSLPNSGALEGLP